MKLRSLLRAASGALMCASLTLTTALFAADSDIGALRAKAEGGNAIAQYNLGMAYLEGGQVPKDVIEAYAWLTLAAENGATGKALKALTPTLSPDQLAAAETRLTERRSAVSNHLLAQSAIGAPGAVPAPRAVRTPDPAPQPAAAPAPAAPGAPADNPVDATSKELATLRTDNAKLSTEVLSAWKELDAAKIAEAAATRRADRADALVKQTAADITALAGERDQLRQQLAAALAAAKPAATAPGDSAQVKALAAAEEARAKATAALESARRELAASQSANKDLAAKVDRLTAENTSAKAQQTASREVSRKLEEAQAAVARLQTENTALKAKPVTPPAAEEARAKAAAALESARRELAASQSANKDLTAKVDRLTAENTSIKAQQAANREVSRKLEEAQAALVRLQAENVELKARPVTPPVAQVSAEELASLKQELARAKQTIDMTVRSYALAKQENDQLKARLATIQQALGTTQDAAAKPAPAAH